MSFVTCMKIININSKVVYLISCADHIKIQHDPFSSFKTYAKKKKARSPACVFIRLRVETIQIYLPKFCIYFDYIFSQSMSVYMFLMYLLLKFTFILTAYLAVFLFRAVFFTIV
jgi:hypothetical protein